MEINGKDAYFVAVKVFLRDDSKLLITHDIFDNWDLPGGRLKKHEFDTPLEDVIKRKMAEELGESLTYKLGEPRVYFRVKRMEKVKGQDDLEARIFAIGYDAEYESGEIELGDNHDSYEWVDIDRFIPESRFNGGWLAGVKEYLELSKTDHTKD